MREGKRHAVGREKPIREAYSEEEKRPKRDERREGESCREKKKTNKKSTQVQWKKGEGNLPFRVDLLYNGP